MAWIAERRAATVLLHQVRKDISKIPTAVPGAKSLLRPDRENAR